MDRQTVQTGSVAGRNEEGFILKPHALRRFYPKTSCFKKVLS
jgi:hypothetical protein